jgi:hypothetical protein
MAATAQKPQLTIEALRALKWEEVSSVYSGKNGKCCCGCAGTHWSSNFRKQDPKYPKTVDDRQVRRVLKVLQSADPKNVECGTNYFSTVLPGSAFDRLYIVYPLASNSD